MIASRTQAAIDQHIEANQEGGHRTHLGASLMGEKCGRKLWLTFNWAKSSNHEARVLRLFQRGHDEEERFVKYLTDIGCRVWDTDDRGDQFRIKDCNGHFGGSLDGVGLDIPDIPEGEPCLLEFKTHGSKSFKKLVEEGMMGSKYQHFVQMQIYMYKMDLKWGLYMAVNKDTDAMHLEVVRLDTSIGEKFIRRAGDIIDAHESPPRVGRDATWWQCKWCDFYNICHFGEQVEKNCRTCVYSKAVENGQWQCGLHHDIVRGANPMACNEVEESIGCVSYAVNPNMRFS